MSASARQTTKWCYTLHDYTEDEVAHLKAMDCTWHIFGKEVCPDTGRRHLQGHIIFRSNHSMAAAKRALGAPRVHLEMQRGTNSQAADYCRKEGDSWETGRLPADRRDAGAREKRRWDEAWDLLTQGRIDEVPKNILLPHYQTCRNIMRDKMPPPANQSRVAGVWIWGPPGLGKTSYAVARWHVFSLPDGKKPIYYKACNKWWCGYDGEPCALIDDIDKMSGNPGFGHYLKIWLQQLTFQGQWKGTSMHMRPRTICITSNYSIEELFAGDDQLIAALTRRMREIIHIATPADFDRAVSRLTPERQRLARHLDQVAEPSAEYDPVDGPGTVPAPPPPAQVLGGGCAPPNPPSAQSCASGGYPDVRHSPL